jgi:HEAT repeat protein
MFDEIALRLLDVLERGDDLAKDRAMKALAQIGPDAAIAVPKLIGIMSSEEPLGGLQEQAIATLTAIGRAASEAVPKLIEIAAEDHANARGWCIWAFESFGPAAASAVPLLIDILLRRVRVDPDPFYVGMAAGALGEIGAIEALPALLQVLQEAEEPETLDQVIRAIGKLGPEASEAAPALVALAHRRPQAECVCQPYDIRGAVRAACAQIGKPLPPDPAQPS